MLLHACMHYDLFIAVRPQSVVFESCVTLVVPQLSSYREAADKSRAYFHTSRSLTQAFMQDMLVCKQAYTKQLFFLKHQAHTVQVHHTHMILIFH